MKGSLEGVLPMLALFIIAGTVSFQSIPIAEALGEVLGDSATDINRVIDSRVYGEFYYYNSIPQVAEYAVNDAAYDQGQNNGNITWSNENIDAYSNIIGQIRNNWQNETENNFNSMLSPSSSNSCQIAEDESKEYDLYIYPDTDDFRNTDEAYTLLEPDITDETIEAKCDFEDGSALYREDIEVRPEVEATSNRYIQLADESVQFMLDLEDELNSVDPSSASRTACDATQWSSAESAAVSGLEDNVQDAVNTVKADYPDRNGLELENVNIITDTYTYDRGTTSDVVKGNTTESGPTNVGDCNCETCYESCDPDTDDDCDLTCTDEEGDEYDCKSYDCNCDDEYEVEVEAEPTHIDLEWRIKDSEQTVIVRGSSENLEFIVDLYEHEFQ